MLDTWFESLGARLMGIHAKTEVDAIPEAVQQGLKKIWDVALASGQKQSKLLRAAAAESEKRGSIQLSQWEVAMRAREGDLRVALEKGTAQAREILSGREALVIANSRAEELRAILDKQQAASDAVIG